jgi:hypothetical protein
MAFLLLIWQRCTMNVQSEEGGPNAWSRGKRMEEVRRGTIRNRVGLLHHLH